MLFPDKKIIKKKEFKKFRIKDKELWENIVIQRIEK